MTQEQADSAIMTEPPQHQPNRSPIPEDPTLVVLLNPLVAKEWALIRTLRLLEAEATDEGLRQVLKRLRIDSSTIAANLVRLVRETGGIPIDVPHSISEPLKKLSFDEKIAEFRKTQIHHATSYNDLVSKVSHEPARQMLLIMSQLHAQNAAWLTSVLSKTVQENP